MIEKATLQTLHSFSATMFPFMYILHEFLLEFIRCVILDHLNLNLFRIEHHEDIKNVITNQTRLLLYYNLTGVIEWRHVVFDCY